ncbi:pectin lyase-like protein [Corynespora cassiicola Philippines]|uniref:pectin lyase n=1 Tax=Corynespora cassiicola Philippines TaxID=1448308 RepID=A0A2T2NYU8_CORCC|nr:pectin lyase-like protein [Corynespora cassiicola Philippines]
MHYSFFNRLWIFAAPCTTLAQVVGKPYGFAAGVTGGGSTTAAVPKDINELKSWLADNTPRVILIDKTYDFLGSEGTVTETGCRLTDTCTAENGGQDTIKTSGCDANERPVTVKYDKASYLGMPVGSNKSLVGVGNRGKLLGKGLRFNAGAKNIIIQNIHIDVGYVWGGDAISLSGNDGVWIDHCKISNTGRQMFVSHYEASRVTISNTEFDGRTQYSHSCNGDHYWTIIIAGTGDKITLDRNYLHDVSGRAPKIGSSSGTQVVHAVNNWFASNTGHNFDVSSSGRVLIEGNRFETSNTPITSQSDGSIFNVPDAAAGSSCAGSLGRNCEINALSGSGAWPSRKDTAPLAELGKYKANLVTPIAYGNVKNTVNANYGIGRI